jgi:hypothetical protein
MIFASEYACALTWTGESYVTPPTRLVNEGIVLKAEAEVARNERLHCSAQGARLAALKGDYHSNKRLFWPWKNLNPLLLAALERKEPTHLRHLFLGSPRGRLFHHQTVSQGFVFCRQFKQSFRHVWVTHQLSNPLVVGGLCAKFAGIHQPGTGKGDAPFGITLSFDRIPNWRNDNN